MSSAEPQEAGQSPVPQTGIAPVVLPPATDAVVEPQAVEPQEPRFPLAEARKLVEDLSEPRPMIYWLDYLGCAAIGWGGFALTLSLPDFSQQLLVYAGSTLALYRAVLFIHELAHRKPGTFRVFRAVWDLTCGFVLMVPSFLYAPVHIHHHARKIYGGPEDGEYLPFAALPRWRIVFFLAMAFVLPILFPLRFLVLAPISLLVPRLRARVWEGLSSLTIDFDYKRPPVSEKEVGITRPEQIGVFIYGVTILALVGTGVLSVRVIALWYFVMAGILFINSLRTLAAHGYRNSEGAALDWTQQFFDSNDIPGSDLWSPLWAPVGLRYHATHHLFPSMPYHSLGEAHRRLSTRLSAKGLYLQSTQSGLWSAIGRLWSEAGASSASR